MNAGVGLEIDVDVHTTFSTVTVICSAYYLLSVRLIPLTITMQWWTGGGGAVAIWNATNR